MDIDLLFALLGIVVLLLIWVTAMVSAVILGILFSVVYFNYIKGKRTF